MARYPDARWKPLPQHGNEPAITARVLIYHTMVGTLAGVDGYFRSGRSGGIESHFGMACGKCEAAGVAADGAVWQWMDTGEQADANYKANAFAISVETCDHYTGGTYTNPPWSDAQLRSLVRLGLWAAAEHGIPRRKCPTWDGSGFGYHSMWGAPSPWTPAVGKTCPNPTRIKQFNDTVLPAIIAGVPGQEDDMTQDEHDALMWLRKNVVPLRDEAVRMTAMGDPAGPSRREVNNLAQVREDIKALQKAVAALQPPPA